MELDSFDYKSFVNNVLSEHKTVESISQATMKLQMATHDASDALFACNEQLSNAVPTVLKLVAQLQGECEDLQSEIVAVAKEITEVDANSQVVVLSLVEMDSVATKMLHASSVLSEIKNWKSKVGSIEVLITNGDVFKAVTELQALRVSLDVLCDSKIDLMLLFVKSEQINSTNAKKAAIDVIQKFEFRILEKLKPLLINGFSSLDLNSMRSCVAAFASLKMESIVATEFLSSRKSKFSSYLLPQVFSSNSTVLDILTDCNKKLESKLSGSGDEIECESNLISTKWLSLFYSDMLSLFDSEVRSFSSITDYTDIPEYSKVPYSMLHFMLSTAQKVLAKWLFFVISSKEAESLDDIFTALNSTANFLKSSFAILLRHSKDTENKSCDTSLQFSVSNSAHSISCFGAWIGALGLPLEICFNVFPLLIRSYIEGFLWIEIPTVCDDHYVHSLFARCDELFDKTLPQIISWMKHFVTPADMIKKSFTFIFSAYTKKFTMLAKQWKQIKAEVTNKSSDDDYLGQSSTISSSDNSHLLFVFGFYLLSLKLNKSLVLFKEDIATNFEENNSKTKELTSLFSFTGCKNSLFSLQDCNLLNEVGSDVALVPKELMSESDSIQFLLLSSIFKSWPTVEDSVLNESVEISIQFIKEIESLVVESLIAPLQSTLSYFLIFLRQFSSKSSASDTLSFSLTPSDYITQIGEALFSTVHLLEPLLSNPNYAVITSSLNLESRLSISFWLTEMSLSILKNLVMSMTGFGVINDKGKKQLICDFDYLQNVMVALGVDADESYHHIRRMLT